MLKVASRARHASKPIVKCEFRLKVICLTSELGLSWQPHGSSRLRTSSIQAHLVYQALRWWTRRTLTWPCMVREIWRDIIHDTRSFANLCCRYLVQFLREITVSAHNLRGFQELLICQVASPHLPIASQACQLGSVLESHAQAQAGRHQAVPHFLSRVAGWKVFAAPLLKGQPQPYLFLKPARVSWQAAPEG